MPACELSPDVRKSFGKAVGNDLLKRHGKQKNYSVDQVKSSVRHSGYPVDWSCWAMCIFTSPLEFDSYHSSIGEVCDLATMKSAMTDVLTDGASTNWFNLDFSWLDWPDIDFAGLFEFFDWS